MGNFVYFTWTLPGVIAILLLFRGGNGGRFQAFGMWAMVAWIWASRSALTHIDAGIFPLLVADVPFYAALAGSGVAAFLAYLWLVERRSLASLDWRPATAASQMVAGGGVLLATLLVCPAIVIAATGVGVNLAPDWDMLGVGFFFGVPLAGIVEEGLFRGVLLERLMESTTPGRAIVAQAALFSMAHLGYFPWPSHGIFYVMLFVLGLVWGWTAHRFGLLAAAIAHGGLVLLTVPAALP